MQILVLDAETRKGQQNGFSIFVTSCLIVANNTIDQLLHQDSRSEKMLLLLIMSMDQNLLKEMIATALSQWFQKNQLRVLTK